MSGPAIARSLRLGTLGLAALIAVGLAACQETEKAEPTAVEPPAQVVLVPVDFDALPGWSEDRVSEALPALHRSCARLLPRDDATSVGPDGLAGSVADWRPVCETLMGLGQSDDDTARAALESLFRPFEVRNNDDPDGVFTGYYEAELRGALTQDSVNRWPLYKRPTDLLWADLGDFRADLSGERILGRVEDDRLVPYHARSAIDAGALGDNGEVLLWVDDPVDAFFLHIQGSGRVILPDGQVTRVGYAGSNGHPYTGIGRVMLDEGLLPPGGGSAQGIVAWLKANPDQAPDIMARNARYIFFQEITGEGPIGAQGVALTAGRSLAIDPSFLPLGAPLWLDTTWPGTDRPLRRLMVAQDTGSAIKGPVRGDFYWGSGAAALAEAGRMKQAGHYYLLLPQAVAERRLASY